MSSAESVFHGLTDTGSAHAKLFAQLLLGGHGIARGEPAQQDVFLDAVHDGQRYIDHTELPTPASTHPSRRRSIPCSITRTARHLTSDVWQYISMTYIAFSGDCCRLSPTEALSRLVFAAPTQYYKVGVA
jgi:hypothetical protein